MPLRGEIYFVYLDPVFGRELGGYKTRLVVVVSADTLNRDTRVVTVVPGTTTYAHYWNVVGVKGNGLNGLTATTYFQCHQVRAIDAGRITSGRPVGRLTGLDFDKVEKMLWRVLGWLPDPERPGAAKPP